MKNRTLRISLILAILTLVTSCFMGSTFAKYVTTDTDYDTARVARWGVNVDVTVNGLFAKEYAADTTVNDEHAVAIANTVVSANEQKVIAPGTKGNLTVATISGTPEVAVNVKKEATLTLTGWEVDGAYYCPITITVDGTKYYGMTYSSVTEFAAAVEAALDSDINYVPNTNLAKTHTVSWEWAFEGTDGKQTDEKDTKLGTLAANGTDSVIRFDFTITVTQID